MCFDYMTQGNFIQSNEEKTDQKFIVMILYFSRPTSKYKYEYSIFLLWLAYDTYNLLPSIKMDHNIDKAMDDC